MDPSTWEDLRIDERIGHEQALLERIDGAVATSSAIRSTIVDDYGYEPQYFLPPCVDERRYRPRSNGECRDIWDFLAARSTHTAGELKQRRIVTEISRTDRTKRKDVLIRAFARVREQLPSVLLVVALDERAGAPYDEAKALIRDLHLEDDVVVVGSVWDQLPCLYAVTSVYCTPSVMEGFGMSAQEAAATAKPVVASDLVPFAVEYLLGPEPERVPLGDDGGRPELRVGDGGIVVPADDIGGFAQALTMLLGDGKRRSEMGTRALHITVPYFTWERRSKELLDDLGLSPAAS
jgi:glycosyltransferase involved in cell wall biosynthesis